MEQFYQKIGEYKYKQGLTWKDITEKINSEYDRDYSVASLRGMFSRYSRKQGTKSEPEVITEGYIAGTEIDESEVYQRHRKLFQETVNTQNKKKNQVLKFSNGPICLVFFGDTHFGDTGTDIERIEKEAEIIATTTGMYAVFLGDGLNNFIVNSLQHISLNSPIAITDEWVLWRRLLRNLKDKLKIVVAGNHENWFPKLTGVDFFREVLADIIPNCLYDTDDCRVLLKIEDWDIPIRVRHSWKGRSVYNPTHGIEMAALKDGDFVLGVGAHTHSGGYIRTFNAKGGMNGMAVQVGTYKVFDKFSKTCGFRSSNQSTAIAVLFDTETKSMTGFDNLDMASKYMESVYGGI